MRPLNGWKRLWIFLGAAYLLVVTIGAAMFWPVRSNTQDSDHLQTHLSARSRSLLDQSSWPGEVFRVTGSPSSPTLTPASRSDIAGHRGESVQVGCAIVIVDEGQAASHSKILRDIEPKLPPCLEPVTAVMPNGHVLELPPGTPQTEVTQVRDEYVASIDQDVRSRRPGVLLGAFLVWAVPIGMLYALGWSMGWVIRGFRAGSRSG